MSRGLWQVHFLRATCFLPFWASDGFSMGSSAKTEGCESSQGAVAAALISKKLKL